MCERERERQRRIFSIGWQKYVDRLTDRWIRERE